MSRYLFKFFIVYLVKIKAWIVVVIVLIVAFLVVDHVDYGLALLKKL